MKNIYFKSWKHANDILNAFIDDTFGIYLSRPTEKKAYITFLPEDQLAELCPAIHAPALNERARAFTVFMKKKLDYYKILEDVSDDISSAEQENVIKLRFEAFFKLYEAKHHQTVQATLKHFLGLRIAYDKLLEPRYHLNIYAPSEHEVMLTIDHVLPKDWVKLRPNLFKVLFALYNMPYDLMKEIFIVFEGNLDTSITFLEFMDSKNEFNPRKAWNLYTSIHKVPFDPKREKNPFKKKRK